MPRPAGPTGGMTILNWAGFKAATTFTFDDSQPSQIAHYAELQAVGVHVTFYISLGDDNLAGYDATWTQAVRDGHEIGNHSAHHCFAKLTNCMFDAALPTLASELDDCTSYIPLHTGQRDVWTGASPYGDPGYEPSAQSRFFLYRGIGGGTIGPNDNTDAFNLPCHVAAAGETMSSFDSAIDAAHSDGKWLIVLVHTIGPTDASWFNPVAIGDVTGSMRYAKGLGDDWVDSLVDIGAYWRGQAILTAATPVVSESGTTWSWALPPHFPPGRFLRVTFTGGTPMQLGHALTWDPHGYYEIALDPKTLTLVP